MSRFQSLTPKVNYLVVLAGTGAFFLGLNLYLMRPVWDTNALQYVTDKLEQEKGKSGSEASSIQKA